MKNQLLSLGCLALVPSLFACNPATQTGEGQLGVDSLDESNENDEDCGEEHETDPIVEGCEGRDGLGLYHGFFCVVDGPFITTEEISCQDALTNCEINAEANPDQNITCLWNGETILTREVAPACEDGSAACAGLDGLGSYRGYLCDGGTIATEDISCKDSWANCVLNASVNPDLSITCSWNGVDIFTRELTPGACNDIADPCFGFDGRGSYRGYFCEHPGSIIETEAISCPEARANCIINSQVNPEESISCTWNGMNIFTNEIDAGECAWVP